MTTNITVIEMTPLATKTLIGLLVDSLARPIPTSMTTLVIDTPVPDVFRSRAFASVNFGPTEVYAYHVGSGVSQDDATDRYTRNGRYLVDEAGRETAMPSYGD